MIIPQLWTLLLLELQIQANIKDSDSFKALISLLAQQGWGGRGCYPPRGECVALVRHLLLESDSLGNMMRRQMALLSCPVGPKMLF